MPLAKEVGVSSHGKNFSMGVWVVEETSPTFFLGQPLGLTGSELSLGFLARGTGQPFVHSHKQNEEVYIIVGGQGLLHIDGQEIAVSAGSVIRVSAAGKRALKANGDHDLVFYCLQTKTGSLLQATQADGVIEKQPTSWLTGSTGS